MIQLTMIVRCSQMFSILNGFSIFVILLFGINADVALSETISAEKFQEDFYQTFKYVVESKQQQNNLSEFMKVIRNPDLKLDDIPQAKSPNNCLLCRAITYSMLQLYQSHSSDSYNNILIELCVITKFSDYLCHGIVNIYSPSIRAIFNERIEHLTAHKICGNILRHEQCGDNVTDEFLDFNINAGPTLLNKSKEIIFKENTTEITIAHLSDFHYDPKYAVGSSAACTDPICCRNTSVSRVNASSTVAGKWGDYNVCDSPGYLVENICSKVAANHQNIDMVYYTGDFSEHFEWLTTPDTIKESIKFITDTVKRYFPNQPVVMVLGNHDICPSNAFAPPTITDPMISSKWLYEFVANEWSQWLPESALITLRKGGYYTILVRNGLRAIVLNNNLCFTFNVWNMYGTDDMRNQLQWLYETLLNAEKMNEYVHILGHVPPNTASCVYAWNREYNKIVIRFAHIINGQFFGHTHRDEFNIFYSNNENNESMAVNVAWNGGSGTSFIGLNSNYRIYFAAPETFEIVDHETWIFDLAEANANSVDSPNWFKEYTFKDAYGLPDLSPKSLNSMMNDWLNDTSNIAKFWQRRFKQSNVQLAGGCDENCRLTIHQEITQKIEYNFF